MLTPELLAELRSPAGEALLARSAELIDDPFAAQKLRGDASFELASAAVEQVRLRRRAAARFSQAGKMWFAPGLLEQASGETVSEHRAGRFHPWLETRDTTEPVGDFCCGLGGDALALAALGPVIAVDRDPLALALTAANAEALGVSDRIRVVNGSLPRDAPEVPAAWIDPGRREEGVRTRRLDRMSPSLEEILTLREHTPHLGIKLSPATVHEELDHSLAGVRHEREFVSVRGECRELVVWTGELATAAPRRATVLPAGAELSGEPEPFGAVYPSSEWLLEPDPAVIRAGLVGNLAGAVSGWPIDARLAYLAVSDAADTPFGTLYRVGEPEPFSARALAARLRQAGVSEAVLKTRGSAIQPEALLRELRGVLKQGRAGCRAVVFITRLDGRPKMFLGERVGPGVA